MQGQLEETQTQPHEHHYNSTHIQCMNEIHYHSHNHHRNYHPALMNRLQPPLQLSRPCRKTHRLRSTTRLQASAGHFVKRREAEDMRLEVQGVSGELCAEHATIGGSLVTSITI